MPRQIQAPDGRIIEFPDSMQDAAIEAAMGKLFPAPSPVAGVAGGVPPGPAKPPLPNELKPDNQQDDSFWKSEKGFIRTGLRQAMHGVEAASAPGMPAKYGGASQVIRGLGRAAIPAALPFAAANPLAAAVGLAGSAGGGAATGWTAKKLGAGPEAQDLASDLGAAGGGAAAGLSAGLGKVIKPSIEGLKGAARGAWEGVKEIPVLGKVLKVGDSIAEGYRTGAEGPRSISAPMASRGLGSLPTEAEPSTRYVQHLGDMRINGRTPAPPKLYDIHGREIPQ